MKKLIVANWKSNKTVTEATDWAEKFVGQKLRDNREYVICPPDPLLSFIVDLTEKDYVHIGVQDISPFGAGAYTGEVSGYSLQQLNVEYAIVGHSERRLYLHETSEVVSQKALQALDFKITPIVCVDRDQFEEQALFFDELQRKNLVVAYEPVHAISTFGGKAESLEETLAAITNLRKAFGDVKVLYGGSVDAENSLTYLESDQIDGLLVGHVSLDAQEFAKL